MTLVRSFVWALAGDATAKVAVLVTSLIAARALAPVDFALYLGLSATAILAASLWDCGVSALVTRELAAGRVTTRQVVGRSAFLRVRTAPVWLLSFGMGAVVLARQGDVSGAAIGAFGAASLLIATCAISLAMLRAQLRFRSHGACLAAGRWVTAACSALAMSMAPADDLLVLGGALFIGEATTLVASVFAVAGQRLFASGALSGGSGAEYLTLRRALPFAANSVLTLAYNRFDIVLFAALTVPEQLARYAPASRIQDALLVIPGVVSMIALPIVTREWHADRGVEGVRRLILRVTALGLFVSVPATLAVFIYAPDVIGVVIGEEYEGATTATRILVWSVPVSTVTAVLIAALAGTDRALDTTRVFVVAFAVAIGFHCALDWWWGATGAAVASLSREPAALVAALYYARKAGLLTGAGSEQLVLHSRTGNGDIDRHLSRASDQVP